MRRTTSIFFVTLLLVAAVPKAWGADKSAKFFFQPEISCGQYISDTTAYDVSYRWWLMGWISAHNHLMPGIVSLADTSDVQLEGPMLWLHNYCSTHPLDTFGQAAVALINELAARARRSR